MSDTRVKLEFSTNLRGSKDFKATSNHCVREGYYSKPLRAKSSTASCQERSDRSVTHGLHKGYTFPAERITREAYSYVKSVCKEKHVRRNVQGVHGVFSAFSR